MINLQKLNLKELDFDSKKELQGGWYQAAAFFIIGAVWQWGFAAGQEDRNKK